jgi:hypothetical protein
MQRSQQGTTSRHRVSLLIFVSQVLILIMARLESRDLQRMEAVCKHTRALGAALFPSIRLPLFQHQRAAVRLLRFEFYNLGFWIHL